MKNKKINTLIICVLSVLLVAVVVGGSVWAWFGNRDSETSSFTLGDAVTVSIAEEDGKIVGDSEDLPFDISSGYVVPGMKINSVAVVNFTDSTTDAILRVKLTPQIVGGSASEQEIADVVNNINTQIQTIITDEWMYDSSTGWFYFTGGSVNNNTIDVKQSMLMHINCVGGKTIKFLSPSNNQNIVLPGSMGNNFSTAEVSFKFSVQALQASIPNQATAEVGDKITTNIFNVEQIFNDTFGG